MVGKERGGGGRAVKQNIPWTVMRLNTVSPVQARLTRSGLGMRLRTRLNPQVGSRTNQQNEEIKPDDVFLVSTEGLAGAVYKNSSCEILLHDIFICCGLETPDTTFLLSNLTTLSWLAQQWFIRRPFSSVMEIQAPSPLSMRQICWPAMFTSHHERTAVICQLENMTDWTKWRGRGEGGSEDGLKYKTRDR